MYVAGSSAPLFGIDAISSFGGMNSSMMILVTICAEALTVSL